MNIPPFEGITEETYNEFIKFHKSEIKNTKSAKTKAENSLSELQAKVEDKELKIEELNTKLASAENLDPKTNTALAELIRGIEDRTKTAAEKSIEAYKNEATAATKRIKLQSAVSQLDIADGPKNHIANSLDISKFNLDAAGVLRTADEISINDYLTGEFKQQNEWMFETKSNGADLPRGSGGGSIAPPTDKYTDATPLQAAKYKEEAGEERYKEWMLNS